MDSLEKQKLIESIFNLKRIRDGSADFQQVVKDLGGKGIKELKNIEDSMKTTSNIGKYGVKNKGSVNMGAISEGVGKAGQAIKQGMANQGMMNRLADDPDLPQEYNNFNTARRLASEGGSQVKNLNAFFTTPMAIPALGGALGTGAIMAGGAGLAGGLGADAIISEKLKTDIEQAKAKKSMDIARALEAANPELVGEIHAKAYNETKRKK